MKTFTLYQFKFWRYLLIAVALVLSLVFGTIILALRISFDFNAWDEIAIILLTLVSLILAVLLGARVSTYTYIIEVSEEGLQMVIESPFPFMALKSNKIAWDDLEAYNIEDYDNGVILNFSVKSTGENYSFTNSIFKKSTDIQPFFEALKKGADAFNSDPLNDQKQIGTLPGFYAGTFALWAAIILGILMIVIPILLLYMPSKTAGVFPYLKLIWFYLLSLIIIRNVYFARKPIP